MANDTANRLTAVPQEQGEQTTRREFGVIEGRLDLASRVARFLGTTLLVTFIVGLVGALVLHATIIENQRDLDSQRSEIARIATQTEAMRSELAELEAPARIVEDARELGMIEAPSIEYLTAPGSTLDDLTLSIAANQLRANG
jgi:cell division protein FtsL